MILDIDKSMPDAGPVYIREAPPSVALFHRQPPRSKAAPSFSSARFSMRDT